MTETKTPKPTADRSSRKARLEALRMRAPHIAGQGINAIGLVNDLMLAQDKEAVRHKNGEALPPGARRLLAQQQRQQVGRLALYRASYDKGVTRPATPEQLREDAEGRSKHYQHSRTLGRNMKSAGNERPAGVHAHHIVAHADNDARDSRTLLYGWGIAINDVDNGVFLPAYKTSVVPELSQATRHAVVHTGVYHAAVFARLQFVGEGGEFSDDGRDALRSIKGELLQDTFPYRPEDKA